MKTFADFFDEISTTNMQVYRSYERGTCFHIPKAAVKFFDEQIFYENKFYWISASSINKKVRISNNFLIQARFTWNLICSQHVFWSKPKSGTAVWRNIPLLHVFDSKCSTGPTISVPRSGRRLFYFIIYGFQPVGVAQHCNLTILVCKVFDRRQYKQRALNRKKKLL